VCMQGTCFTGLGGVSYTLVCMGCWHDGLGMRASIGPRRGLSGFLLCLWCSAMSKAPGSSWVHASDGRAPAVVCAAMVMLPVVRWATHISVLGPFLEPFLQAGYFEEAIACVWQAQEIVYPVLSGVSG
jgi:hypothetical protein